MEEDTPEQIQKRKLKGKGIAFTEEDLQQKAIAKIVTSDEILEKNVVIDPDVAEVESVKKAMEIRNAELDEEEEEDDEIPQEVLETLINLKRKVEEDERMRNQADDSIAAAMEEIKKRKAEQPETEFGPGVQEEQEKNEGPKFRFLAQLEVLRIYYNILLNPERHAPEVVEAPRKAQALQREEEWKGSQLLLQNAPEPRVEDVFDKEIINNEVDQRNNENVVEPIITGPIDVEEPTNRESKRREETIEIEIPKSKRQKVDKPSVKKVYVRRENERVIDVDEPVIDALHGIKDEIEVEEDEERLKTDPRIIFLMQCGLDVETLKKMTNGDIEQLAELKTKEKRERRERAEQREKEDKAYFLSLGYEQRHLNRMTSEGILEADDEWRRRETQRNFLLQAGHVVSYLNRQPFAEVDKLYRKAIVDDIAKYVREVKKKNDEEAKQKYQEMKKKYKRKLRFLVENGYKYDIVKDLSKEELQERVRMVKEAHEVKRVRLEIERKMREKRKKKKRRWNLRKKDKKPKSGSMIRKELKH